MNRLTGPLHTVDSAEPSGKLGRRGLRRTSSARIDAGVIAAFTALLEHSRTRFETGLTVAKDPGSSALARSAVRHQL